MRGQVKIYQKKLAARRRRRIALIILCSVAAAGLIVSGLSYLSELDALAIRNISVAGNERLSSSTVDAIVLRDLAGNYLGFFSRANALLYPHGEIISDIAALPLVRSVSVSRDGFSGLAIDIAERDEVAEWCDGQAPPLSYVTATDTTAYDAIGTDVRSLACYSVDEDGLVFAAAAPASAGAATSAPSFIYRGILAGDPVGQQLMPAADFKKVQFFMTELSNLPVDPREVYMYGTTTAPDYMDVLLGGGGRLVIDSRDDLSSVLDNIATVLSDKIVVPDEAAFLDRLDYMKLDIGDKIIYKLR
ncbi:MAG: FtsQ-type POTRA domain-containing protein [Patescibacteria group bacterium]|nr:FtsQ-type POTRA domain-containing protein [Patescibacteria group bacterium]MDE2116534.1 FtsQ-type POTRA domain-containing protein [Patescibacteria group bacterium]